MNAFHKGELAVQEKACVASMATRIGGSIKNTIHPVAQNFLRDIPFLIAASVDSKGRVWASAIHGAKGFVEVPDETRVLVKSAFEDALLISNIAATGRIGLLAIEFETRLRMRLNGKASFRDGLIEIEAEEVFSNCPKYIQAREREAAPPTSAPGESRTGKVLSMAQQALVARADTFFIASFHPERGADASHRGGNPGFVKVEDSRTLVFPDYSGNNMFQTLGNIEDNGRAGLLFIDFDGGKTLQLSGRAEILWDEKDYEYLPGAKRAVRFSIGEVIENEGAFPAGWRFIGYSPANP
jgi:predicted pyridoxine 5'-phosphate oxidase superfamily flavin-nucleotide-binding protein